MNLLIACNEQAISTFVRSALVKLGIDCPQSHVLSHEAAHAAASAYQGTSPLLVVFSCRSLGEDELAAMARLCDAANDRCAVVVVSTTYSANIILQAVRNGAIDCLTLNGNLEGELRRLLERWQTQQGERKELGKLFTVVSPVGGAGASTLALNLAAIVAQRQKKCALLDLHWRGGDLAGLLNGSPPHTLLSLAGKSEQFDRSMLDQSLWKHESGIHLLASPEPFGESRMLQADLLGKVVQTARAAYESVVVDLEDCEHAEQMRTLAASDRVLIPMRPDFMSLFRTKRLLDCLAAANLSLKRILIVLNRGDQPRALSVGQVAEALGSPAILTLRDDPLAVNEAANMGVPLATSFPNSKAALGIVKIVDDLLGSSGTRLASNDGPRWFDGNLLARPMQSISRIFSLGSVS